MRAAAQMRCAPAILFFLFLRAAPFADWADCLVFIFVLVFPDTPSGSAN
jgi:hypothetical protein